METTGLSKGFQPLVIGGAWYVWDNRDPKNKRQDLRSRKSREK
jgi:hypothetical protein